MRHVCRLILFGPLLLAWPLSAGSSSKVVAFLCAQTCSNLPNAVVEWDLAFLRSLEATVPIADTDVAFDMSGAGVGIGRLPEAAQRLVRRKVDVIVAVGNASARAARRATTTTPIVMIDVTDPVEEGLITTLARPGGNVTGLALPLGRLSAKHLEILKDIQPRIARVAVLWDPAVGTGRTRLAGIEAAGQQLGVRIVPLPVASLTDLERAWLGEERIDGLLVLEDLIRPATAIRGEVAQFALRQRVPAIASERIFVSAGGLMSYGPSRVDLFERAGTYVAAILSGRQPAHLPVQEPTRFELVVSKTTARALGLTIPPAVLARADEVIE